MVPASLEAKPEDHVSPQYIKSNLRVEYLPRKCEDRSLNPEHPYVRYGSACLRSQGVCHSCMPVGTWEVRTEGSQEANGPGSSAHEVENKRDSVEGGTCGG